MCIRDRGVGGEEGHIAIGDQHGPGEIVGQLVETALHRSTGALDIVLVGDDQLVVILLAEGDHLLPRVPDDDLHVVRTGATGGADRVPEQGAPTDPVEHLGGARPHSGALTCSEDDDGHGASGRHGRGLPGGWAGLRLGSPMVLVRRVAPQSA